MIRKKVVIEQIEQNALKTIKNHNLINKKDKVLVACSGGKDSTAALYLIKKLGFNVKAITVDLGIGNYSKKNLKNLEKFCFENKIKLIKISFKNEFGHSLCYLRDVLKSKGVKLVRAAILQEAHEQND